MTEPKKFPFDFMDCVEVYPNGSAIRTYGDTFWTQKLAYHSATASKIEYIGFARPGSGISASAWAIKQIRYNASALETDILWATGSLSMQRVWDDRTGYSYS